MKFVTPNLVSQLWTDRPEQVSLAPMVEPPGSKFAGETVASKLKRVREAMKEAGAKAHVIGALDQVAWLLNIRSRRTSTSRPWSPLRGGDRPRRPPCTSTAAR